MLRRTIEAALDGQSREVLLNALELARRVVRDLAEGKLLIFLGAGASLGGIAEHASGERAPTSKELTTAIGERFGVAVTGESTLAGVASVAAQQSGEGSVKGHVAEIIRSTCRKPLRAHRALARILPKIVVSTNYDDLYERALEEQGTLVTKVVRPNDIPQVTDQRPTLVKLHGDVHSTDMMVLTKQDYRRWEDKAQSLVTQMLADLQRYAVVFVGYSLNDPNLERLLAMVESRLGVWGPKRYALVRSVDDEARAGWSDLVDFVEGDATEFLEELADLREQGEGGPGGIVPSTAPPSVDPSAGLQRLREQIRDGDTDGALESCDAIEGELRAVGALNTAATAWLELATAALDWGEFRTCMLAYTRAGSLFLEARTASRAESVLKLATELAEVAQAPGQEVEEAHRLLLEARMYSGEYSQALRDIDQELDLASSSSFASLLSLRTRRAQINEALGETDAALEDLREGLRSVDQDALFERTATRATVARILFEGYGWEAAHHELNLAVADVASAAETGGFSPLARRCLSLVGLVRGNLHQALGEDAYAMEFYKESLEAFEKSGDTALAVSALQGFISVGVLLGYAATDESQARLIDYARSSLEHQYLNRKEGEAVENLAVGNLSQARADLLQALTAAKGLHSLTTSRRISNWYGEVLLKAGVRIDALLQFVLAGNRKKGEEVASELARTVNSTRREDFDTSIARLVEIASVGDLPARGAALAALRELADVLPERAAALLTSLLAGLDELPSSRLAQRDLASAAAALAGAAMPLLDYEGAKSVGQKLARVIGDRERSWTLYRESCRALVALAQAHPEAASALEAPLGPLVELVEGDVVNDRHGATEALVNLAVVGNAGARERALTILRGGNTVWHVNWRQLLGDVSQEELERAIRATLPRSVSRVQQVEGGISLSFGGLSPTFLRDWDLPERVKDEVSEVLAETAVDPLVMLPDRQDAALVLGWKASQLGDEGRSVAIRSLMNLLVAPFETHDAVGGTDNLLTVRVNTGRPEDVRAAAAFSLLALSDWMGDNQRSTLMRGIEGLRASQLSTFGNAVSGGLQHFSPRSAEEEGWLATRLLLLMNTPDAVTRRNAAQSLGKFVERGALPFDAELADTSRFLAQRDSVIERVGAAHALRSMAASERWNRDQIGRMLEELRADASFSVRVAAQAGR